MSEQRVISRAGRTSFRERQGRTVDAKRATLFRETPRETCKRVVLGIAWALKPKRLHNLVPLARLWLSDLVGSAPALPGAEAAGESSELAGVARDLSIPTLIAAYERGLFPHGHIGTPKWLSPMKRGVLFLDDFHISTRLRSKMRQNKYMVTFDRDFEEVIKVCAGQRPGQWHLTWITPRIMHAYAQAFDEGYVHSFEVWNAKGKLAGGGYGVAVGRVFVIESMFFRESNTSKIGFSVLAWHLAKWGFVMCDNKWLTPTTAQMGFHELPRAAYLRRIDTLVRKPAHSGRWQAEADTKTVADWRTA